MLPGTFPLRFRSSFAWSLGGQIFASFFLADFRNLSATFCSSWATRASLMSSVKVLLESLSPASFPRYLMRLNSDLSAGQVHLLTAEYFMDFYTDLTLSARLRFSMVKQKRSETWNWSSLLSKMNCVQYYLKYLTIGPRGFFLIVCTKIRLQRNLDNEKIRNESWRPRSHRPTEKSSAPRRRNKQTEAEQKWINEYKTKRTWSKKMQQTIT